MSFPLGFMGGLPNRQTDVAARGSAAWPGYAFFRRMVLIGFVPTEGVVRMEASTADPAAAARFSSALIAYAEERVDKLTNRLRDDQMSGTAESFAEAEQ